LVRASTRKQRHVRPAQTRCRQSENDTIAI
jgi:hypothetical protein